MKFAFFGAKKTAEEKAREQALKQQQKDEKAHLAELQKQQKAHDARARQAAKAEKQRAKQQASEWKKQEKLQRAREREEQQRLDKRDKQERKRIAKIEKLHAAARRRDARRARKQLVRRRRKMKKLRKLQLKQQRAQDASAHDREIDELLVEIAAMQSPVDTTPSTSSSNVTAPPAFKKRAHCGTCRTRFHVTRLRHHCRNCGESCCRPCLSKTKRPIPWHSKRTPQKICVTCDALVFSDRTAVSAGPATAAVSEPIATQSRAVDTMPSPPVSSNSSSNSRPASGSGISVSLSTRRLRRNNSGSTASSSSTASGSSMRSKKPSLWTLPIRPLLKRKRSVEQLRNRQLDFELQLEKAAQLSRQGQRSLAVELQPQHALLAPQLARAS